MVVQLLILKVPSQSGGTQQPGVSQHTAEEEEEEVYSNASEYRFKINVVPTGRKVWKWRSIFRYNNIQPHYLDQFLAM